MLVRDREGEWERGRESECVHIKKENTKLLSYLYLRRGRSQGLSLAERRSTRTVGEVADAEMLGLRKGYGEIAIQRIIIIIKRKSAQCPGCASCILKVLSKV